MKRKLLHSFIVLLLAPVVWGAPIEYGKAADLCGTRSLFVDSGTYLEGRNNIVKIVEQARMPNLAIASSLSDADVFIQLTQTGRQNWAQWSVFVVGESGSLRLVHQLADTDEGDGLQRYWPSSKIARKFVELHQAANRAPGCKPERRAAPGAQASTLATEPLAELLNQLSDHFVQLKIADLSIEPSSIELMVNTKTDILAGIGRLERNENSSPIDRLERLEVLHELQRNLDYFWFGLESLAQPSSDEGRAKVQMARERNLRFTKTTAEVRNEVAMNLLDDLLECAKR